MSTLSTIAEGAASLGVGRRGWCPPSLHLPGIARRAGVAVGMCLTLLAGGATAANRLNGIRMHDAPDHTRVVLDTRAAASYKLFTMESPARVVVDLQDTKPAPGFAVPRGGGDVVRRIRAAGRNRTGYRVVLDLAQPARPKQILLKPIAPYGHRLVIDLYPATGAPPEPVTRPPDSERLAVVAVDAGHGGEDPGAIGPGKVQEKHVVLAIARQVRRYLDAMPGITARLVRSGDYYISLRGRTRIAREKLRADVFVSIHADAFRLARVHGASVYALSDRGATSEEARWLAAGANRADLMGGVEGQSVSLDDKDPTLASVLVDMSMDAKMENSLALGEAVLGALSGTVKLHKRHVEQAGFVVLKAPDVPSILVETGYISNPAEARRLATPAHQRRVAAAVAAGVQAYLSRRPPPGTMLASMDGGGALKYVIKRGDTLSEIAVRNRVSLRSLRALNGIAGDRIRIGQVLLIPPPGTGS